MRMFHSLLIISHSQAADLSRIGRVLRRRMISAPKSTIVVGTNMLIGGLLKVTVQRPGSVRSVLNCEGSGVAHLLRRLAEPYRSDLKPARTSSEKSFGCSQAAKCPPLGSLLK